MIGSGILKLATENRSNDRRRSEFKFSRQMAKRTSLQKQSLSARCLLAKLFSTRRTRGRFTLCPQICRSTRIKSRDPNDSNDDHSFFQDRFTFVWRCSFASGTAPGRTFCTATPAQCQEVRYAISAGILRSFASRCDGMSHLIVRNIIRFPKWRFKNAAVCSWNRVNGKNVVKRGTPRQSRTGRVIWFYLIQEG